MANILNIDTSTDVCSVALSSEGGVKLEYRDDKGQNHAQVLSGFVKNALDFAKAHELKLDAVAVTIGPGSYTGLRIGLSEAKGVCFGMDLPLIGVNTLQLLSVSVMFKQLDFDEELVFIPMIDARRMEVFTAVYNLALEELMEAKPLILDENSYAEFISTGKNVLIFGNGADKAKELLAAPNVKFINNIKPIANDMVALSERAFREGSFLDLAYSTPLYLKEFQGTTPKRKFF